MADQFAFMLSIEFELPFSKGSKKGCQEKLMKLSTHDGKMNNSVRQVHVIIYYFVNRDLKNGGLKKIDVLYK
jgi:hypothetical protein